MFVLQFKALGRILGASQAMVLCPKRALLLKVKVKVSPGVRVEWEIDGLVGAASAAVCCLEESALPKGEAVDPLAV